MQLSQEQIKEIESFASMLMSIEDVAVIIGVDVQLAKEEFADMDSVFYQSYQRGYLTTKATINNCIIELAKRNSGPAQTEALRILKRVSARNKG